VSGVISSHGKAKAGSMRKRGREQKEDCSGMNSTLTIGKRFTITSGVALLLSSLLALVAMMGFNSVRKGVHSLATDSIPGIVYSSALVFDVVDLQLDQFRYLMATDPADASQREATRTSTRARFAVDMKGYDDSINLPEDRQNFSKVQPLIDAIDSDWAKILRLVEASDRAQALSVNEADLVPKATAL
jgi:Four helix bundle sensory module for signal transduction